MKTKPRPNWRSKEPLERALGLKLRRLSEAERITGSTPDSLRVIRQQYPHWFNRSPASLESALADLQKYPNRPDFIRKARSSYNFLSAHHPQKLEAKWGKAKPIKTWKRVLVELKNYTSQEELRAQSPETYNWLLTRTSKQFIRQLFEGALETALQEARKCKSRQELAPSHRECLRRVGLLDRLLPPQRRKWNSVEECLEVARTCSSREEFSTSYRGAYDFLKRHQQTRLLDSQFPRTRKRK